MQTGQYGSYRNKRKNHVGNYSDPSKPNYRPEWWRGSAMHWQRTLDWCGFLEDPAFKDCYLCQVAGEFPEDRATRLEADSPEPFFKDAVKDHSSIFSQFELAEDAPASLIENDNNVDGAGNSIYQWATGPLNALFRDGGALIGADMPPANSEDDLRQDRVPRLLWVPLRDVYWPEYRNYGGAEQLAKIAIRRGGSKANPDGGLKAVNYYWVYELEPYTASDGSKKNRCILTHWLEEDEELKPIKQPRIITGADGEPLSRLPFSDKLSFLRDLNMDDERQIMSPFADILNLNIEHYNKRSEYGVVLRKTALPTPKRSWAEGVPDNPPPLNIGPGRCIELDAGSDVSFLELQGASLPELRQGLYDIEKKIEARDNKLFSTAGNRSATEAQIENQKAKAGYPGVKMLIESAMQDVFTIWETFANPSPDIVGGIVISDAAISAPPNSQELASLFTAVERTGLPVEALVRKSIRDGHFERDDFANTPFEAVLNGDPIQLAVIPEGEVIQ